MICDIILIKSIIWNNQLSQCHLFELHYKTLYALIPQDHVANVTIPTIA